MARCPRCHARIPVDGACAVHGRPTAVHAVVASEPIQVAVPPPWRLERWLATSATGHVHVVTDGERRAVLKSARHRDADTAARFTLEAEVLRTVGPPTTPGYVSHGVSDGRPYTVMEWIDGSTLAEHMERAGSEAPLVTSGEILAGVLEALGALHRAGYVHRDLKPENLLLVAGAPRVRLVDFGLGRALHNPHDTTQAGQALGTTHYVAPEQLRGGATVDHRADLYAFGVIAYELVAGRPPFIGDRRAIEYQHQVVRAPSLRELREVPDAIAQLVAACLEKQPDARPMTAEHALAALRATDFADTTDLVSHPAVRAGRADSVVLAWCVGGDPVALSHEITRGRGVIVRHQGEGLLAAFVAAEHAVPLTAALVVAHELARTHHAHVALHITDAFVRRTASGGHGIYGPDVASPGAWIPRIPFTGVVLTAAAAVGLGDAVRVPELPGFSREPDESATDPDRGTAPPPFVGRANLLADLAAALAQPGQLITLSGAAGTGKTRLLTELATRLTGCTVVLVAAQARFPGEPADDERVLAALDPTGRDARSVFAQAAARHVVLLVDNVEHLSASFRALLMQDDVPLARVVVSRRAMAAASPSTPRLAIELPALPLEDAQALVRQLLRPARLVPDVLIDRLVVRGLGNPGLLEALARDLKRRGGLRRHAANNQWYVAADHHDTLLAPPGADWLALRAYEDLPPEMASVVATCAILGPRFCAAEIASTGGLGDIAPVLAWLVGHGVLVEHEPWFRFRDPALPATVSATVLDDHARARLHARALQYWESQPPSDVVGWLARIAYHAARTNRSETAAACLVALARACARRGDLEQSERLLARASSMLVVEPAIARAIAALR